MPTATLTKSLPPEIVQGTFFERNVSISQMFVHYRDTPGGYARPLNKNRLSKLIDEFDRQALGVLLLNMRSDGSFAVIDGQHRMEAAAFHGLNGLDAYVYIDLTLQDEARLYRKFGDYLKQTARDRFLAALAEGQPETVAINRILEEHGLHVSQSANRTNGVAAIASIIKIGEKYGPQIMRETIGLLHDAWDGNPRAYVGSVIVGVAMFLDRFRVNGNFNRPRLIERMRRYGVDAVEQRALHVRALDRGALDSAWGKAILATHDALIAQNHRLGQWPELKVTERGVVSLAANLARVSAKKSRPERQAQAKKSWRTRRANAAQRGPTS